MKIRCLWPLVGLLSIVCVLAVVGLNLHNTSSDAAPPVPGMSSGYLEENPSQLIEIRHRLLKPRPKHPKQAGGMILDVADWHPQSTPLERDNNPAFTQLHSGVVGYNAGNTPEVPVEDSNKCWLNIFLGSQWRGDRQSMRLYYDLCNDRRLRYLMDHTRCRFYTPSDPIYQERFAKDVGNVFPTMWLQDKDGRIICNYTPRELAVSTSDLADDVVIKVDRWRTKQPRQTTVQVAATNAAYYPGKLADQLNGGIFRHPCPTEPKPVTVQPQPPGPPIEPMQPTPMEEPMQETPLDESTSALPLVLGLLIAFGVIVLVGATGMTLATEWRKRTTS